MLCVNKDYVWQDLHNTNVKINLRFWVFAHYVYVQQFASSPNTHF